MQELKIFEKEEFGKIRTVEVDGKVYFVASDVAKALGYKDQTNAIKQHCRWVAKHHIPHPQSKTKTLEVNVIPQGDIMRLAANSELPGAEKFESWIFDEVIPSVLNHGGYIAGQENMSDDELLEKAILVAQRKIAERDKIIQEKQKRIDEMRPKEIFADAVTVSDTCILIGELAKIIKQNGVDIGQNRMFEWMRDEGYLIKRRGTDYNMPTQRSMGMDLFEIKERTINNLDGSVRITKTTLVTGRG